MSITFPTIASIQRTTDGRGARVGGRRTATSLRMRIDLCLAGADDEASMSDVSALAATRTATATASTADQTPAHWSERVSA